MTQPLALVVYERLLPGSQLKNKLEDLGYRVQTLTEPAALAWSASQLRPLLVIVDLDGPQGDLLAEISKLRQESSTAHVPVIAFSAREEKGKAASASGVTLFASESAVLSQLPQLLDQALVVE